MHWQGSGWGALADAGSAFQIEDEPHPTPLLSIHGELQGWPHPPSWQSQLSKRGSPALGVSNSMSIGTLLWREEEQLRSICTGGTRPRAT